MRFDQGASHGHGKYTLAIGLNSTLSLEEDGFIFPITLTLILLFAIPVFCSDIIRVKNHTRFAFNFTFKIITVFKGVHCDLLMRLLGHYD